jgi:hypothetical protein
MVFFSLDFFHRLTSIVALRFWSMLSFRHRVKESFLLPECTLLALFWILDTDKCSLWVAGTWICSMTRITQNWIHRQFVHWDMFLATCYACPLAVSYCHIIFIWVWLQTFVCMSVSQTVTNESWLVTRNIVIIQIYTYILVLHGSMDVLETLTQLITARREYCFN